MAVLTTFTVLGQTVLGFTVSPVQILTSLGVATGLDAALTRRRSGNWALPLSAVITGLSVALLLRSPDLPVFVLAAGVAIGSKHLVRRADGGHVFNPSNIGIVVALLFTQGLSMPASGMWGDGAVLALLICCVGVFVVFQVRRLALVATFLVAHVAMTVAIAGRAPTLEAALPASTLVFCFFMITDPRTAPRARPAQVAYALLVAGIDQALTSMGSVAAPYLALVVVCAIVPLLERTLPGRATAPVTAAA